MKVKVPESIADINLDQYQRFAGLPNDLTKTKLNYEKLNIFCGIDYKDAFRIPQNEIESLVKMIDESLSNPNEFKKFFNIGDTKFGFHPNINDMGGGEYGDLMDYNDGVDNYHRLMAILFRPVTSEDGMGNYTIAAYNGTDTWCEQMKQMPLNIVNGALVFFFNLSRELRIYIQKYSAEKELQKATKQQTSGINGVGTLVTAK